MFASAIAPLVAHPCMRAALERVDAQALQTLLIRNADMSQLNAETKLAERLETQTAGQLESKRQMNQVEEHSLNDTLQAFESDIQLAVQPDLSWLARRHEKLLTPKARQGDVS